MTVLVSDIVESTARAAELGDRAWRRLLGRHDKLMRAELAKAGGTEIDTTGDGFLATFETPSSAIACATAAVAGAEKLGLALRTGIHTGECEPRDGDIIGLAVNIAARIAAVASPGQVLVSATVKDLSAGGDHAFTARGSHALKGIPGSWLLFEATAAGGARPAHGPLAGGLQGDKPLVLVVDDHPLWRQTIVNLVGRSGAVRDVIEASDGPEAVERALARRPDVVVMDMNLPGLDGIAATRQITEACAGTRVLVLSSSDDEQQVVEVVQAGATGYLLKTAGPAEILEGIRRVHAGELVFPPSLANLVLGELRGSRRSNAGPLATLTEREVDVLALMAEGRTNDVIGETLHLSSKTVEAHVTSIFSKLGLDPAAGGHRRVLAVITYLSSRSRRHVRPVPP